MPNRIIKETITTSETLDELTPEEERFFYRLIVKCDDYGLMDARPKVLRAACFPLKVDSVKDATITAWLNRLAAVGLVELYIKDDRPYLHLKTWEDHQQIRAKRAKHPLPNDEECTPLQALDSNGNHVQANVPVIQSNPIQSNTNPNTTRRHSVPNKVFEVDSLEYQLAEHLRDCILTREPSTKVPDSLQDWASHADLLMRLDNRPFEEAKHLIAWCQQDSFWCANILSMATFRKQYDKLKRKATTTQQPQYSSRQRQTYASSEITPELQAQLEAVVNR
jgi:hypothetical protein